MTGILTAEEVWGEMRGDIFQGLPEAGDQGLTIRTPEPVLLGRRPVLPHGGFGNAQAHRRQPLERALCIGDEATEGRTLNELYGKMASQPFARTWGIYGNNFGVADNGRGIVLDEKAPCTREAICSGVSAKREIMNEIRVEIRQISASTSEASLRNHRVLIDRPQEKGGTDKGPMGGELFLASIGGCFMSNLLAAINAREADISDVRMDVTGTITEAPGRFSAIEVLVTANGPAEQLERLVEVADRGCIMMNTLRGTLEVRIRITNPLTVPAR